MARPRIPSSIGMCPPRLSRGLALAGAAGAQGCHSTGFEVGVTCGCADIGPAYRRPPSRKYRLVDQAVPGNVPEPDRSEVKRGLTIRECAHLDEIPQSFLERGSVKSSVCKEDMPNKGWSNGN
jgi:hypothetical protein